MLYNQIITARVNTFWPHKLECTFTCLICAKIEPLRKKLTRVFNWRDSGVRREVDFNGNHKK